jgi:hypothetical protein
MWQELVRVRVTPDEIRACYRLYAAHRKSREICTFPRTIPVTSNAGDLDDLAVLLRLHTSLEVLARDIGHGDANGDLRPALRRTCRSPGKDARIVWRPVIRSRRSGGALRQFAWPLG